MLARTLIEDTYLSAEQLGIREDEREALIWVRGELASGRIEHDEMSLNVGKRRFRMSITESTTSCGTVACIGGWMGLRLGAKDPTAFVLYHHILEPLFYPYCGSSYRQTPAQAVRAIDAWLTGAGDRCWHLALESEG